MILLCNKCSYWGILHKDSEHEDCPFCGIGRLERAKNA